MRRLSSFLVSTVSKCHTNWARNRFHDFLPVVGTLSCSLTVLSFYFINIHFLSSLLNIFNIEVIPNQLKITTQPYFDIMMPRLRYWDYVDVTSNCIGIHFLKKADPPNRAEKKLSTSLNHVDGFIVMQLYQSLLPVNGLTFFLLFQAEPKITVRQASLFFVFLCAACISDEAACLILKWKVWLHWFSLVCHLKLQCQKNWSSSVAASEEFKCLTPSILRTFDTNTCILIHKDTTFLGWFTMRCTTMRQMTVSCSQILLCLIISSKKKQRQLPKRKLWDLHFVFVLQVKW